MKRLESLAIVLVLMYGCSSCEKPEAFGLPDIQPAPQEEPATSQSPEKEDSDDGLKPDPVIDSISAPQADWETYIVPKGDHHNALRSFSFFSGDTLRFLFVLDSSAIYQTQKSANQADWNKLMGFSDCGSYHHTNSIRFVWRYYQDELQIGEYRYTSSKREFSTLGSVAVGDTNLAEIVATAGKYELRLNDALYERPRGCNNRSSSYWLYPYFGGDETAPREVKIAVQHLKPRP